MATYKILLIEDEPGWNDYLRECLTEAVEGTGHEANIRSFEKFGDAWKALKGEEWHLLVTDINLGGYQKPPDKMGMQLTSLAGELMVPCIVISGDPLVKPEDVRKILKKYSAYDYFGKDEFDRYGFRTSVRQALGITAGPPDFGIGGSEFQIPDDEEDLNAWWQDIKDREETYYCYAFFLVLPRDKEAIAYITEQAAELDLISRDKWLIVTLSERELWGSGLSKDWARIIRRYVHDPFSVKVADMLKVDYTTFPCLVLFQDIFSPRRIVVHLKGLSSDEIGESMRSVAKCINDAANNDEDPLVTVQKFLNREARRKTGKAIASKVTVLAGKTFEEAIKLLISELTKLMKP